MLANDGGTGPIERGLRGLCGAGPRPSAKNPDAGQLLVGAAAVASAATLTWLSYLAGLSTYAWACSVTGFAAVASSMGASKYAEFVAPQARSEPYDEAGGPIVLMLTVGGLVLGFVNYGVAIATSYHGHALVGFAVLLVVDCVAAVVCAYESEIDRYFSMPRKKLHSVE
ncbi:hypothetical protein T492DRAFT_995861 [Pavlovales sp. CCMP2436]|nr:hypothetical protein T492DRAFT_995861 [Pavlovales sp. CCMP2436]|mmetsp:Transcript_37372/g.92976  ORF Transcript_37372/g.92976 Transcript_37372/m.92976 type:complete len:169 (-) Transcript_37372:128-634(-)